MNLESKFQDALELRHVEENYSVRNWKRKSEGEVGMGLWKCISEKRLVIGAWNRSLELEFRI